MPLPSLQSWVVTASLLLLAQDCVIYATRQQSNTALLASTDLEHTIKPIITI
uniref:Uncharacterized protein n=1 Tax=Arundo donax TaxID=35708 RepID=A0A0A9AFR6_ARUDO